MRRFLCIVLFLLFPAMTFALDVPELRSHVNDYAGLFSPAAAQELEQRLSNFERSDSTQIVVLTIPTLAGENLEEYSIKVAETWRIGQKKLDNGAILLIAKQEHKVRIEVGRGLEGKLTDLVAGRIIRGDISPRFKAGDFDGGVSAGVSAIMAVVRGEYQARLRDLQQGEKGAPPIFTLLIFLFVACVFLGALSKVLGGLAGAVGLPIIASLTFPGLAFFILAGLGIAGFMMGLFFAFLFGGGGFSGGGGDFGGGGASGDW